VRPVREQFGLQCVGHVGGGRAAAGLGLGYDAAVVTELGIVYLVPGHGYFPNIRGLR
jgi:hypothetical protein